MPSLFTRAKLLRVMIEAEPLGLRKLKLPPSTILPSAWTARASTLPLTPGSNVASVLLSGLMRATWLRVSSVVDELEAKMVEKAPPTTREPSASRAIA